jgi:hypothetical protein
MNNIKANILPFDTCLSLSVDFMSETTRGREDISRQCEFNFTLNDLFYKQWHTHCFYPQIFLYTESDIYAIWKLLLNMNEMDWLIALHSAVFGTITRKQTNMKPSRGGGCLCGTFIKMQVILSLNW